jgi:hypothetical protein
MASRVAFDATVGFCWLLMATGVFFSFNSVAVQEVTGGIREAMLCWTS